MACDGHSYEGLALAEWLTEKGTSPITREALSVNSSWTNRLAFDVLQLRNRWWPDLQEDKERLHYSEGRGRDEEVGRQAARSLLAAMYGGEVFKAFKLAQSLATAAINESYESRGVHANLLHHALRDNMPAVACVLLSRPDFDATLALEYDSWGHAPIHLAVLRRDVSLGQAILSRASFSRLSRVSCDSSYTETHTGQEIIILKGDQPSHLARRMGFYGVWRLLQR